VDVLRILLDQCRAGGECEMPADIVARLGLGKASGGEFDALIRTVVASNEKAVADYRSGKAGALNFLVGQVMRETKGRADPKELGRMISAYIDAQEA
jgi:aspartyl-tRNA(Asn)/glutamyl-tRNA(Gln) amidotransferase subunit B